MRTISTHSFTRTQQSGVDGSSADISFFKALNEKVFTQKENVNILGGTPRPDQTRDANNAQMSIAGMIDLAFYFEQECAPFSVIVANIVNTTFKNGFEWVPRFVEKCEKCGREWQDNIDVCSCGSTHLREPDVRQQEFFNFNGVSLFDSVNDNGLTFLDLCKIAERHRTVADNQYWILQNSYLPDYENKTYTKQLYGIIPVDPRDIEKVYDRYGKLGDGSRICYIHRKQRTMEEECPICGMPTEPVIYRTRTGERIEYTEAEVIHTMEYNPGMIYGFPEILHSNNLVNAIINLDWRVRDYFENVQLPMIIGVNSINQQSLSENVKKLYDQKRENPNIPLFMSMGENGKMEPIKLMENPTIDMWELRKAMVLDIAARYGFPPILLNDLTNAGGLGVETQQLDGVWASKIEQVRGDAERSYIALILKIGFPQITDWLLKIKREDNKDVSRELDVMLKQAQVMDILDRIGFDVEYRNKEINVSDTIQRRRTDTVNKIEEYQRSNFGEEEKRREPLLTEDESLEKFLASMYRREFLAENIELITELAIAEGLVTELFKTIPHKDVPRVYDIIIAEMAKPEGWTIANIAKLLKREFPQVAPHHIDAIARTESNRIATIVREVDIRQNDPPDARYNWVGADDHRTTDVCREIKRRVKEEGRGRGVSYDRLKQIVKEEGEKWAFRQGLQPSPVAWAPHINCRHQPERVYL